MATCVAWWDISSFSNTPRSRRCAAVQHLSCGSFFLICAVLVLSISCQAMARAREMGSGRNGSVLPAAAFAGGVLERTAIRPSSWTSSPAQDTCEGSWQLMIWPGCKSTKRQRVEWHNEMLVEIAGGLWRMVSWRSKSPPPCERRIAVFFLPKSEGLGLDLNRTAHIATQLSHNQNPGK